MSRIGDKTNITPPPTNESERPVKAAVPREFDASGRNERKSVGPGNVPGTDAGELTESAGSNGLSFEFREAGSRSNRSGL